MGLFDFLRRKDERAMPDPGSTEFEQAVHGSKLPGSEISGSSELNWSSVGDASSAEELGKRVASQMGLDPDLVQVDQSTSQTVDLRGTGTREELLEALRQHGIDPEQEGQRIDASSVPGLQKAIYEILRRGGVFIPGPDDKPGG